MPRIDILHPRAPDTEIYRLGSNRSPAGDCIGVDAVSLRMNGVRWMPVMGEFHYTRSAADSWREELLKMKSGGIDCVSTYVFWIHHEETEGSAVWNGDRDLGRFVKIAGELGLRVVVRIGPWCHGEVRNGGLPDWVVTRFGDTARTDAPGYLAVVRRHFAAITAQIHGLLWKQGGPVIAIQIENEYGGPAEHLLTLKQLARDTGLDAPLYTRTGWPDLSTPMPFGELLPLYGAYAEGFWDRSLSPMPGFYPAGFRFTPLRTDSAIATDLLGERAAADTPGSERYPFLTCELGGGMMSSYHRRIRIDSRDIESIVLTKLGSGGNLPGYYMYHGGINPDGLTSLQESQATNYWNDLPEKNYDFQAPIGAGGQLREHYHRLRRLHLFIRDFGSMLAGSPASFPSERPTGRDDVDTLRWSVRSDGSAGFVFVNNYERLRNMPAKPELRFSLSLPNGQSLRVPSVTVEVPANTAFIWPFGLDLAPGIRLDHATAQLVCKIDEEKARTIFFAAIGSAEPEFAFNGAPPVTFIPSRSVAHVLHASDGSTVQVVVLNEDDSLALWKDEWRGRERVFLTRAGLVVDGATLRLTSHDPSNLTLSLFPPLDASEPTDGVFQSLMVDRVEAAAPPVLACTMIRKAGPARAITFGWTTPAVATAPTNADFDQAATWQVELPRVSETPIRGLLRIRYTGDAARVRLGEKLMVDDFFNGDCLELDLGPHSAALAAGVPMIIEILPLCEDAPILLPDGARPAAGSAPIARLDGVSLVPIHTSEVR